MLVSGCLNLKKYYSKRHIAINAPQNLPSYFRDTLVPPFLSYSEAVLKVFFVSVFPRHDQKYSESCCQVACASKPSRSVPVFLMFTLTGVGEAGIQKHDLFVGQWYRKCKNTECGPPWAAQVWKACISSERKI